MQIQLINNQFDSELKTVELTEKTYNNILESVKKPIVVVDKSKIPQWKFCTIKGNKRCTENMDKTNMLILDFDDSTYTYQEFEHQYQEYKYILHNLQLNILYFLHDYIWKVFSNLIRLM